MTGAPLQDQEPSPLGHNTSATAQSVAANCAARWMTSADGRPGPGGRCGFGGVNVADTGEGGAELGGFSSEDLGGFSLPVFESVEPAPNVVQGPVEGSKSGLHACKLFSMICDLAAAVFHRFVLGLDGALLRFLEPKNELADQGQDAGCDGDDKPDQRWGHCFRLHCLGSGAGDRGGVHAAPGVRPAPCRRC